MTRRQISRMIRSSRTRSVPLHLSGGVYRDGSLVADVAFDRWLSAMMAQRAADYRSAGDFESARRTIAAARSYRLSA